GAQGPQGAAPGAPASDPFGFGCSAGGGGGGGGANPGPYVLAGNYTVALVVDDKTVETKAVHVVTDPEVALTEAQRKQLFDRAMEMHELQKRATEAAAGVASLNRELNDLSQKVSDQANVPSDVKASFASLKTDAAALAPKFPLGGGGGLGGGGRGGADTSITGRIAQAKNGMMGGMWPTSITMKAYTDAKAETPKALSDANALFAKAATVSASLAKFNLTLTVPKPVDAGPGKKKTNLP
ncbi:MAG TPA: hypothetical protein VEL79_08625, partial [Vicinamibacterales bacterium]|nr:hypothetical protein [Vicinamibacterales bacterium]